MNKQLRQPGRPPSTIFSVHTLPKVDDTRPDGVPPAQISKTVLCGIEGEGGDIVRVRRVTDKASCCVGIEAEHEEKGEVMRVPECLETLMRILWWAVVYIKSMMRSIK